MAPTVPTITNLPPPPTPPAQQDSSSVRYSLKSQLPLCWAPGPPTSTLLWPQMGQSLALASLSPPGPLGSL